jgi:hypothetical protein
MHRLDRSWAAYDRKFDQVFAAVGPFKPFGPNQRLELVVGQHNICLVLRLARNHKEYFMSPLSIASPGFHPATGITGFAWLLFAAIPDNNLVYLISAPLRTSRSSMNSTFSPIFLSHPA